MGKNKWISVTEYGDLFFSVGQIERVRLDVNGILIENRSPRVPQIVEQIKSRHYPRIVSFDVREKMTSPDCCCRDSTKQKPRFVEENDLIWT